jgi:hypothetical protein
MKYILLALLFVYEPIALAFDKPTMLVCSGNLELSIKGPKGQTILAPGIQTLSVREHPVFTVLGFTHEKLVKIYPDEGIHWVILDKKHVSVNSDGRSFIIVNSKKPDQSSKRVRCEFKDE